jgi:hypothetical protein
MQTGASGGKAVTSGYFQREAVLTTMDERAHKTPPHMFPVGSLRMSDLNAQAASGSCQILVALITSKPRSSTPGANMLGGWVGRWAGSCVSVDTAVSCGHDEWAW